MRTTLFLLAQTAFLASVALIYQASSNGFERIQAPNYVTMALVSTALVLNARTIMLYFSLMTASTKRISNVHGGTQAFIALLAMYILATYSLNQSDIQLAILRQDDGNRSIQQMIDSLNSQLKAMESGEIIYLPQYENE